MKLIVIRKKYLILAIALFMLLLTALVICVCFNLYAAEFASENESEYLIMIYIEEKKLYLFKENNCIKVYPIASGKKGYPSPIGEWKIIEKGEWGEGFGGHWLGLNVPWGTYRIHGTTCESSIGRAASHGCIRMFNKDVGELYDMVSIGTPVIISNGPYGPFGTGFRELIPGDRGADVMAIQKKLKELGYYKGKINGIYGDDLKKALYAFQKDNNLKVKYTITYEDYLAMGFKEIE